jgi:hypothetical protein
MKPMERDIRREGRRWSHEEFDQRMHQVPEKIEYVNGIFASDRERLYVLGMLLENLGKDSAIRWVATQRRERALPFADRSYRAYIWRHLCSDPPGTGACRRLDRLLLGETID